MTFDMPAPNAALPTFVQWLIGTALVAFLGGAVLILIYAVINGPEMRATAESHKAEEIAQENRASCAELGMHFGTPGFATCSNVLAKTRRLEQERSNREPEIL